MRFLSTNAFLASPTRVLQIAVGNDRRSRVFVAILVLHLLSLPVAAQQNVMDDARERDRAGVDRELSWADLQHIESNVVTRLARWQQCVVAIEGGGSGVIINRAGTVLTAAHLTRRARRQITVTLHDGRQLRAITLGSNEKNDTSAAKILESGPWPFLDLGDSKQLKPGDWCVALGHPIFCPAGQPCTARVGRIIELSEQLVRTDCPIMAGDSGGPLVDLSGRVIAINSSVDNGKNRNNHVPIERYKLDWGSIRQQIDMRGAAGVEVARRPEFGAVLSPDSSGSTQSAYLGVRGESDEGRVRIRYVVSDSPAEKAGLKPEDVIRRVDGAEVHSFFDVLDLLTTRKPGQTLAIEVNRYGQIFRAEVTLETGLPIVASSLTGVDFGRDSHSVKHILRPMYERIRPMIVEVETEFGHRVLGTVVSADGLLVAKASELDGALTCTMYDGRRLRARTIATDKDRDLAVLKIEAVNLPHATELAEMDSTAGRFVFSCAARLEESVLGTTQNGSPRGFRNNTATLDPAGFGAELVTNSETAREANRRGSNASAAGLADSSALSHTGVDDPRQRVVRVLPRTLAESCGLLAGDRVRTLNGQDVDRQSKLDSIAGQLKPAQKFWLEIERQGEPMRLAGVAHNYSLRTEYDRWGGGPFSRRRFDLAATMFHDCFIAPEQCGGPLINLRGKIVGINIARTSRTLTLAIPIDEINRFVSELSRPPR